MPVETEPKRVSIAVGPLSTHRKEVRRLLGKLAYALLADLVQTEAGLLSFTDSIGSSESPLSSGTELKN